MAYRLKSHSRGCSDAPSNSSTRWTCQQGPDHRAYRRAGSPTRNLCPLVDQQTQAFIAFWKVVRNLIR